MVFPSHALDVVSSPTICLPLVLHLPPVPDAPPLDCGVNSALWGWIKVAIRSNSMEKLIAHESKVTPTSSCWLVLCSSLVSLLVPPFSWSSYAGNISSRLSYLETVEFFLRRLCCTVGYESIFPVSSTVRHIVERSPGLIEVGEEFHCGYFLFSQAETCHASQSPTPQCNNGCGRILVVVQRLRSPLPRPSRGLRCQRRRPRLPLHPRPRLR